MILIKIFSTIGKVLRFVINTLLGTLTYILGIAPVAIVGKLVKKDFMKMKIEPLAKSYWETPARVTSKQEYYRQF